MAKKKDGAARPSATQPKSQIVYRPVAGLVPLENNPRTIKDVDFYALVESLENNPRHLEARPLILSDRTGQLVIIAGNMRYRAALHLKLAEVPTILLQNLSEEEERQIVIRDNINSGGWDMDMLANEWDDLPLSDWGVPGVLPVDDPVDLHQFNDYQDDEEELPAVAEKKEENLFPVSVVLGRSDLNIWKQFKESLKLKADSPAFIELLHRYQASTKE